jgi:p-cumate 2,3-dioxygenase alpha subunit
VPASRQYCVCRERAGSTRLFRCFYHAWAFDLGGKLAAVPGDDAYTPAFDREVLGLKPAPRLEIYRGMMFVSFDPGIEGLVDYLGNAREYLDLMLEFGGEEVEIVHGSQAYSMKANWKLLVENSMDGCHAIPTHQRIQGIGLALGAGHAVIENRARALPITCTAKAELDAIRDRLIERVGPERAHRIADYSRNLFIFPNLIPISSWHTIRTFYRSPPITWRSTPGPTCRAASRRNCGSGALRTSSHSWPCGVWYAGRRLRPRGLPVRLCGVARIVVVGHIPRHGARAAVEPGRVADARLLATVARVDTGNARPHRLLRSD